MPLELQSTVPDDASRFAQIEYEAYDRSAFTPYLFPGEMPPELLAARVTQLAEQMTTDSTSRWAKIVDTDMAPTDDKQQIVAMCRYNIYTDGAEGPARRTFSGPGINVEACEAVFGGLYELRQRTFVGKACVYLAMLVTDPKHNRRGAAGMLVQKVIEDAKEHGLDARLESSMEAHALYQRYGFKNVEKHEVDFSRWGFDRIHETWAMIHESSGNSNR